MNVPIVRKQIHLPSKGAVGILHENFSLGWSIEQSSKLNDVMDWAQQTINENGVRKNTTEQYFGKVVCLFGMFLEKENVFRLKYS